MDLPDQPANKEPVSIIVMETESVIMEHVSAKVGSQVSPVKKKRASKIVTIMVIAIMENVNVTKDGPEKFVNKKFAQKIVIQEENVSKDSVFANFLLLVSFAKKPCAKYNA